MKRLGVALGKKCLLGEKEKGEKTVHLFSPIKMCNVIRGLGFKVARNLSHFIHCFNNCRCGVIGILRDDHFGEFIG
jgi:hypothetical protein